MSLDVYIKYKQPKKRLIKRDFDGVACGSTIAMYEKDNSNMKIIWVNN